MNLKPHAEIKLSICRNFAENSSFIHRIFAENNLYIYRKQLADHGKIHL
jgi:hypothetical protein